MHLLNLDYQPAGDTLTPQKDVKISLPGTLTTRKVQQATLHRFDAEPAALKLEPTQSEIVVTIPELKVWAVVQLK